MKLQDIPDSRLVAELQRRMARIVPTDFVPCHNCARFRPGGYSAPDSYNPCQAGNDMEFRMPDDTNYPDADAWGFTRPWCESREERAEDEMSTRR